VAGRLIAPAWLDPVFSLVEIVDRRRRHIPPIRQDGLLSVELGRSSGDLQCDSRVHRRAMHHGSCELVHFADSQARVWPTHWIKGTSSGGRPAEPSR
jgi:hypothetical protein